MATESWTVRPADERLRPLLARDYVGFAESGAAGEGWLEAPTSRVTVILNLGERFGGLPDSFAAGLTDTWTWVERGDAVSCLDLKLTPLGAYTLLGVPMHELTGKAIDVGDLLGPAVRPLLDALREAPDWEERFRLLDRFLVRRAEVGPRPAGAVAWAWRRLAESGGQVPVGRLAEEVGWSHRHLVARFREQVGLTPKTLARIVRFNGLLRGVEAGGEVRWAELAVDHGYYDQAHLYRDFRQFLGLTPAAFLAQRGVTFFQDGSATAS
ncbi:MAG: AraC family transcriptional regulator [Candidatus Dormibacteraeota bacterium]|nr:AraC family transcriptional regulator [Candidatus Dormibacteraeota bacterium]MBO0760903.1 AraC family transcriptional regulator [Candidatus Dormibacteraeota bacterium]